MQSKDMKNPAKDQSVNNNVKNIEHVRTIFKTTKIFYMFVWDSWDAGSFWVKMLTGNPDVCDHLGSWWYPEKLFVFVQLVLALNCVCCGPQAAAARAATFHRTARPTVDAASL